MRAREKHISPAFKHGAYSATALLPTESKAAFRKFHRQVRADLNPTGALQDEIVMTIGNLFWRKKNLNTMSRSVTVGRLLEKYGKLDFKNLPTILANGIKQAVESIEGANAFEEWVDELREEFDAWRELGEAGTLEGLNKELDVRERLDSEITRSLKQLLMVRGIKSISEPPASSSPNQIPKRLRAA
jgi:hypothetical protein